MLHREADPHTDENSRHAAGSRPGRGRGGGLPGRATGIGGRGRAARRRPRRHRKRATGVPQRPAGWRSRGPRGCWPTAEASPRHAPPRRRAAHLDAVEPDALHAELGACGRGRLRCIA
ncbi:hypothetical protein ACU686_15600 [Yinghuangia aomiensis]